ncbi:hypothetical protein J2Z47_001484 [Cohnella thailandensis]|nr:hypothetical protein [Cohnella thailandensis]
MSFKRYHVVEEVRVNRLLDWNRTFQRFVKKTPGLRHWVHLNWSPRQGRFKWKFDKNMALLLFLMNKFRITACFLKRLDKKFMINWR